MSGKDHTVPVNTVPTLSQSIFPKEVILRVQDMRSGQEDAMIASFLVRFAANLMTVQKVVKIRKIVQLMLIKMVFQRSQEMIAMIVDLLERFVVNMVTVQKDVNIEKIVQLMAEILE